VPPAHRTFNQEVNGLLLKTPAVQIDGQTCVVDEKPCYVLLFPLKSKVEEKFIISSGKNGSLRHKRLSSFMSWFELRVSKILL